MFFPAEGDKVKPTERAEERLLTKLTRTLPEEQEVK